MSAQPVVTQLGPKMRLLRTQCENTKTTCMSILLQMPLRTNTAENMVLASFLSHSSKQFPSLQKVNEQLEELYGAVLSTEARKLGESYCLRLSMTCLRDDLALDGEPLSKNALELLLDLLLNPNCTDGKFNEEQLALETRLAIEDIESTLNDKRAYALHRMLEIMCADEPFGLTDKELLEGVKAVTPESLYAAWQQLLSESVVSISIVGNSDFEEIKTMLAERFCALETRHPVTPETLFVEAAEDVTEVTEEMDVNQSKLVLGFRAGMTSRADNYFATRVMTDVFGGGVYSRLFNHVREKLSLCYYCSARLDREKGLIVVQSGIEKANKQAAFDEILKQLDIMKRGEFTDEELAASKAALSDAFRGISDTAEGIDAFYSIRPDGEIETPDDLVRGILAVTREDIIAAANRVTLDTVYLLAGKETSQNA